ncbi:hypothetical protein F6X42_34715 [Paraburkholderia sp. WC7.3b]|uniref:Uncharacterized protein n=2 Tax=Burkholderiaceae TaxID=119060 RepID=A0ABR7PZ05_9BURK|nr:hypothetical protein [Paraburkholderia podalyriae]
MTGGPAADLANFDNYGTGVIVSTARDQRAFDFLVARVGCERVIEARLALPGQRRAYVSNIAKQLKIVIPEDVMITSREEGRRQLSAIKTLLSLNSK